MPNRKQHGFTIVELLIVIVVIAILAAITIVAFNSIKQRATNSAILNAAGSVHKLLLAYISTNSAYPGTAAGGCIILTEGTSSCSSGTPGNNGLYTTASNALATIGTVPKYVPPASTNNNGALYLYDAARTLSGQSAPLMLIYYLKGVNQNCGGFGILADGTGTALNRATLPYTYSTSDATACVISIPAPS